MGLSAYQNYVFVGDVVAIIMCGLCHILVQSTYAMERTKNYRLFRLFMYLILVGASTGIIYNVMLQNVTTRLIPFIYGFWATHYLALSLGMGVIVLYMGNILSEKKSNLKRLQFSIIAICAISFVITTILSMNKKLFYISPELQIYENYYGNPFWSTYLIFMVMLVSISLKNRKRVITHVFRGIVGCFIISIAVVIYGLVRRNDSYTTMTYTLPLLVSLFIFHYRPFDQASGCLSADAFNSYVRSIKNRPHTMITLYLQEMDSQKILKMSDTFYHFNEKYYKSPALFKMTEKRFVLIFLDEKNPNHQNATKEMLHDFEILYHRFQMDYRIVIIHSSEGLKEPTDYLKMEAYLESKMSINSVYFATDADIQNHEKQEYILSQLLDIQKKHDLNDPRVLAYAQPVWSHSKETFNTAESLMRLNLPDLGLVFPDQFIPVAEQNELIHSLTMIILNKTCRQISEFMNNGYCLERISVNVSMMELKNEDFCTEFLHVIGSNNIPFSKIAIELTESKNEKDFQNVQNVMARLSRVGIKFYLDDFGTDYSNLERITSLPFDIVKFDRSLTIMSGQSEKNHRIVAGLAHILKEAGYRILFEGVEDAVDVERCIDMNAKYLQGYYYSKPIAMEKLAKFLEREE